MPLRLYAARLAALSLIALAATPTLAAEFTDSAGRHVMVPDHINRAMAADMSAEGRWSLCWPRINSSAGCSRRPDRYRRTSLIGR